MPLIQCPDCGKQISSRASSCPNCGCPSAYFFGDLTTTSDEEEIISVQTEEPIQYQETKKITFNFGKDCSITYNEGLASYAAMFGIYKEARDQSYPYMIDLYNNAESIERVFETIPDKGYDLIFGAIDKGIEYLYKKGVYLTKQDFFTKYDYKYPMDYAVYYDSALEEYARILDLKSEMSRYREAEKASRSRWQGGGFGLRGAIKGAATAAALNMGSDFLHSFGDSAKKWQDDEAIRKKLDNLYNSQRKPLCSGVGKCLNSVYLAMCDELNAIGDFPEIVELDLAKAEALYESTNKYEKDEKKIRQNMLQCIKLYPGEKKYYKVFTDKSLQDTDILDFISFWHINYLFNDEIANNDKFEFFYEYAKLNGVEEKINFDDMSAEQVALLWTWLDAYDRELSSEGSWSKKIKEILNHFYSNKSECIKDILVDYHMWDMDFNEYYSICVTNEEKRIWHQMSDSERLVAMFSKSVNPKNCPS